MSRVYVYANRTKTSPITAIQIARVLPHILARVVNIEKETIKYATNSNKKPALSGQKIRLQPVHMGTGKLSLCRTRKKASGAVNASTPGSSEPVSDWAAPTDSVVKPEVDLHL